MPDVFISYSSLDKNHAVQLVESLSDINFWAAYKDIVGGAKWSDEIDKALSYANALIVVLTPSSVESKWVAYEWAYALGNGKPVIPLQFEEIDEQKNPIHDKLKQLQILPFVDPQANDFTNLGELLLNLMPRGMFERFNRLNRIITYPTSDWTEKHSAIIDIRNSTKDATLLHNLEPYLIKLLDHEQSLLREEAVETLGKIRTSTSIDALLNALTTDSSKRVRAKAAEALGEIGSKRAIPELLKSLYDEPSVRSSAARALGKLKSIEAVDELRLMLKDRQVNMRVVGIIALASIGAKADTAIDDLISLLEDESVYGSTRVCDAAANALVAIRDIKGLMAVRSWAQDHLANPY